MSARRAWLALVWGGLALARAADTPAAPAAPVLLVVVGAPGAPEYATNFQEQAELWLKAGARAGAKTLCLGLGAPEELPDRDRLRLALAAQHPDAGEALWLVLAGHGTFDGQEARFNLRGPDVSAGELAAWLEPFRRPLVAIDASSASAPFLNRLSGANRVVVTATRSGEEVNFARFGRYLAEAVGGEEADVDKDGQVSLLEAFLTASRRVAEFYKTEGRLATEHALLDDNGDGLGTPADWFRGVRAVKRAREGATPDGLRAHQFCLVPGPAESSLPPAVRARRDALELEVFRLRDRKAELLEADYFERLEALLLELAHLQEPPGDTPR